MSASFTVPTVFTAVDRFSGMMKVMGNAAGAFAGRAEVAVARVDRAFRGLMTPINSFRRALNSIGLYVGIWLFIRAAQTAVGVMMDFEQAQVNISAVTGRTIKQNEDLANQARELAVRYGEAATRVSELQLELIKMGFANKGIKPVLEMTPAIVMGSRAMGADPSELAKMLGADLTAFKIPTSQASDVIDMYAKIADLSALDFSSMQTMLANSRSAWAQSGKPLEELLVLMAVLKNAQLHVATSGTGIKNMTIDNAVANKDLNEQLMKVINSENKIKQAYKMYGRRTFQSVIPLAGALESGSIADLQKQLAAEAKGYTESVARLKLESTKGNLALLKTAYQELILAIDDGSGPVSNAIKNFSAVASAVVLITSGSDAATLRLNNMNSSVVEVASSWISLINIVFNLIKALIIIQSVMFAVRAIMFVLTGIQWMWNAALAVTSFLTKKNLIGMIAGARALFVYDIATKRLAISQTLLNLAMYASPLVIFAVGALLVVGALKLMNNWVDDLTSKFDGLTGSIDKSTDGIRKFYMSGVQDAQMFRMLNPDAAAQYDKFGIPINAGETFEQSYGNKYGTKDDINPRISSMQGSIQEFMSSNPFGNKDLTGKIKIDVNDPGGRANVTADFGNSIKPKVTTTHSDYVGFRDSRE